VHTHTHQATRGTHTLFAETTDLANRAAVDFALGGS